MTLAKFIYRLAIFPLVFLLVYGGAFLVKLGNLICWGRWGTVTIDMKEVW